MISFNIETNFSLDNQKELSNWISNVISNEGFSEGDIIYIFCDDHYLLELNKEFLGHDTLTDIISFDYVVGKQINGEIYISVDRIVENAKELGVDFFEELLRVMIHGILHYCGFNDKSKEEVGLMRAKEDYYISKF